MGSGRLAQAIFIGAAIATVIASAIAFHLYTGTPQGKWITGLVSVDILKLLLILILLGLPWLAVWRSSKTDKAARMEYASLWKRINADAESAHRSINETAKQIRAPIEDRLDKAETRLTKLEPGLAGLALRIQEAGEEIYKVVSGGTIQEWKRKDIDDLPEAQQAKLFGQHPDLADWWLGKPKS